MARSSRTLARRAQYERLVPRGDTRSPGVYTADRFWQVYSSHGPWWALGWMRSVFANMRNEDVTFIMLDRDFYERVLTHPVIIEVCTRRTI